MSAKKTVKKKTAAKKAAKVMIEVMSDVMDSIIERVSDIADVTEPAQEHEVFDEDDYNPYAPKGFGGGWEKEAEDIIMPPDEPEPQPVPVEAPSIPSEKPKPTVRESSIVAMGPLVNVCKTEERVAEALVKHAVAIKSAKPPDALTDDALVVQRLINGINHLYGIARLTKGAKGPQPDALRKIQDNIVKAKELITRLS